MGTLTMVAVNGREVEALVVQLPGGLRVRLPVWCGEGWRPSGTFAAGLRA